jgi:lysine-specific demethylase 8
VGEPAGWDTFVPAASRLSAQVNGWVGPPSTISPLHRDPYHNLFCQVLGRKYFRLYAPEEAHRLYPSPRRTQRNTSAVVDVRSPGPSFPGFADVPYREVELGPGDMLYMPPHWWHYVEALSASASISFWYSLPKSGGAAQGGSSGWEAAGLR